MGEVVPISQLWSLELLFFFTVVVTQEGTTPSHHEVSLGNMMRTVSRKQPTHLLWYFISVIFLADKV